MYYTCILDIFDDLAGLHIVANSTLGILNRVCPVDYTFHYRFSVYKIVVLMNTLSNYKCYEYLSYESILVLFFRF